MPRVQKIKENHPKRGRPAQNLTVLEARNEDILKAATFNFARHGYANTDIEVLAAELGIGKGTIYRAFPSKKELFFAALARGLKRMSEHISQRTARETADIDKMATGVRAYLEFFDKNPELIELFVQERAEFRDHPHSTYFEHRRTNIARWSSFMESLMQRGYVRKLQPDWLVETLNQLLYGQILLHHYSKDTKATLVGRANDILTIFFTGILTDEGFRATGFGPGGTT
jgi:AcrR family transcriptional regulator